MYDIEQRNFDTKEMEIVYKPFFENYKTLLEDCICSEVIKNVNEKDIKEFFDDLKISRQLIEFNDASETDKLEIFNQWFKGNLWTLEGAVFDMAIDSIDFEFPNEKFYFD
jgi:hypothetical protein